MYCSDCGSLNRDGASFCSECGDAILPPPNQPSQPDSLSTYFSAVGGRTPGDYVQTQHPQEQPMYAVVARPLGAEKKVLAGLLGIFFGCFGIHKFVLGYTTEGAIMLASSVVGIGLSCFVLPALAPIVFGIIGLIEGIIYLSKSDADFVATYVAGRKGWF